MPVIQTRVDRSSEEFEKNSEAHEALAENLREVNDYVMQGGRSARARNTGSAASCLPGIASRALLDEAHISLKSGGKPHGRYTTMTCRAQASSPESAGSTASNA